MERGGRNKTAWVICRQGPTEAACANRDVSTYCLHVYAELYKVFSRCSRGGTIFFFLITSNHSRVQAENNQDRDLH